MGVTVRQKGDKWYVFITHQGRRKAKAVGDKKAAQDVASKLRAKLALGDFQMEEPERPLTFKEFGYRWLEAYAKLHCRPSTYQSYRRLLRDYAFPRFGMKPLPDVTREDVKGAIADMRSKGLSKSTIRFAICPIREMFNHAIDDGAKLTNPAARMGRFLKDKTDRRVKIVPLTASEVQRLLEAAQAIDQGRADHPMKEVSPSYYLFLLTAVRTGLRLGELIGLRWGDLDFAGRFIEVTRQYTRGAFAPTKSGRLRLVDMSKQLCAALQAAQDSRRVELAVEGRELDPEELVFRNRTGGPLDESNVRKRILRPCLQEAGLRQINPHLLRHTFASLLLANGESLVYVKEQLGHHSIQITVDTYGHLIPGANKAAVDKLDTATICNPPATRPCGEKPEGSQVAENIVGPYRTRTYDPLIKSQLLYQLS